MHTITTIKERGKKMNHRIHKAFLSKLRHILIALGEAESLLKHSNSYPHCDTGDSLITISRQLQQIIVSKGGTNGNSRRTN